MIIENTEIDLNETFKSNYALSPSAVIGYQKDVERYTLPLEQGKKDQYFTFIVKEASICLMANSSEIMLFIVQCGYKYLRQIFDKILF